MNIQKIKQFIDTEINKQTNTNNTVVSEGILDNAIDYIGGIVKKVKQDKVDKEIKKQLPELEEKTKELNQAMNSLSDLIKNLADEYDV